MGQYRKHQRTAKRCGGCGRKVSAPHGEGCGVALKKSPVRHLNIEKAPSPTRSAA